MSRTFLTVACLVAAMAFGAFADAAIAGIKTTIDLPAVRCIRTRVPADDDTKTDKIYFLVLGKADGQAVDKRIPKDKALEASPKKMPADEKNPITIWEGDLDEGEFAALTVVLIQGEKGGKGVDALKKKLADAHSGIKQLQGASLDADNAAALREAMNDAARKVVTGVTDVLPQNKGDRYGGLVDIIVYNDGGEIKKFATPAGLTSGDHFGPSPGSGAGEKIYSKIKWTRPNVLMQTPEGQWYEKDLAPVTEKEDAVRIKMLETEVIKVEGQDEPVRNVTDYLVDVRVSADGKALTWLLDGENPGPTQIHDYWDWAK